MSGPSICGKRSVRSWHSRSEDWQAIVVHDASPSPVVLEQSDERIRLIRHAQNKGLSAARNTEIEAASGKYIGFLDDDDEYTVDRLEHALEGLKRAPIVICWAAYRGREHIVERRKLAAHAGDKLDWTKQPREPRELERNDLAARASDAARDVERRRHGVVLLAQRRRPQIGDRQLAPRAEVLGGQRVEAVADRVEVGQHRVLRELDAGRPGPTGAEQPGALDLRQLAERCPQLGAERLRDLVGGRQLRDTAHRAPGAQRLGAVGIDPGHQERHHPGGDRHLDRGAGVDDHPLMSRLGQLEEPPVTQPVGSLDEPGKSEEEKDDSFAWLESLAAKQGASEGLLTQPEERLEEEPE